MYIKQLLQNYHGTIAILHYIYINKRVKILMMILKCIFLNENIWILFEFFMEVCPWGFNGQHINIGLGNRKQVPSHYLNQW